jgi:cyclohexadieny/prephenate dehydrogenase
MTALIESIGIVGAGHIGSSIARAVRQRGLSNRIAIADSSDAVCGRVIALGLADAVSTDAAIIGDCDVVILCVPVGSMGAVGEIVGPRLKPGAILTDVGSVKAAVLAALAPHVPAHAHLVPAHPVAGLEHSGPDSGLAELFVNRWCIITPPPDADKAAVVRIKALWRSMGSNVEVMTPEHHDRVLAITSHVPHLIAYNIVGTASDLEKVTEKEVIKFSAGGFRDFTRIAASDPVMWRDIFLNNREAVLEMLGRFNEDLAALQRAIRWGDGEALLKLFTRTRAIRRGVIEAGQANALPPLTIGPEAEPGKPVAARRRAKA